MDRFEYKVVPAPKKGQKARGLKRPEEKFSFSIQEVMNSLALEGWEYQRSETLPHEERTGLTSSSTTFRSVLVFRRLKEVAQTAPIAEEMPTPIAPVTPVRPIADQTPTLKDVTPVEAQESVIEDAEELEDADENSFFSKENFRAQTPSRQALPAALRQRASQKRANKDIAAE